MHCVPSLPLYTQEIGLLSAAWDGDKESLDCALGAGVPADCRCVNVSHSKRWQSLDKFNLFGGHTLVVVCIEELS